MIATCVLTTAFILAALPACSSSKSANGSTRTNEKIAHTAGIPAKGAITGALVSNERSKGTIIAATAAREAQLGYTLGGHRIYQPQRPTFTITPNTAAQLSDDAAKKRTSFLSVRIPLHSTWDNFASHTSEMDKVARQLGQYTHPIVFVLEHEPDVSSHARTTSSKGTVAGYSKMLGNMFTAVRKYAPKVSTAVAFGSYKLFSGKLTPEQYAAYLPKDRGLLDIIGCSVFNQSKTAKFSFSFESLVAGFAKLAASEQKPLDVFEAGTALTAGPKAPWLRAMFAYVKAHPNIKAVLWFDSPTAAADPKNDFWLDGDGNDTATLKAYKQATSDPYWVKGG